MFIFMSDFRECEIEAADGEMGKVKDLYIDDIHWTIRYVLVDTSLTLPGRKVLLSPSSFKTLDLENRRLYTSLDKKIIKRSPTFAERSDFSLETEIKLADYYGWTKYWSENMAWKPGGVIRDYSPDKGQRTEVNDRPEESVPVLQYNLRSQMDIEELRVHASNGRIGKIVNAIFDDETWEIQSFVVKLKYQDEIGFILIAVNEFVSHEWIEGDFYLGETVEELKHRPIYKTVEEMHEYLPNT